MKVQNMTSPRSGWPVANQFVMVENGQGVLPKFKCREIFQSYDTVIAIRWVWDDETRVVLDRNAWNYSCTTAKYRNQFLGETTAETERKVKDGTYKLEDLNK